MGRKFNQRKYTALMKGYEGLCHMSEIHRIILMRKCRVVTSLNTTTMLRLVFDGSFKITTDWSLNDIQIIVNMEQTILWRMIQYGCKEKILVIIFHLVHNINFSHFKMNFSASIIFWKMCPFPNNSI